MKVRKCLWHECGETFSPNSPAQLFCCTEHRIARGMWKQRRGSPLVDLLIAGDWDKLAEHRETILKEIQ